MKTESSLYLRPATEDDLPTILQIINYAIANSTAIYDYEPRTMERHREWFSEKQRDQQPVVVAEHDGMVCGYGTYGVFRPGAAYQYSREHSIHVASGKRGLGIGAAIMEWLIQSATESGYHTLIAGIDASNEGSRRFHARFGFVEVAHFKEVGYKFDRWLDLVLMQLILNQPSQQ